MDVDRYYESLSAELSALKDRVRHLIDDRHWLTDGEWKESVLRTIIRRHLPASVGVGSGFVITPEVSSRHIDVLIYDASKPILFRDSDLVFITRDACLGVIEVKSRIADHASLDVILMELAAKAELISANDEPTVAPPFIGLFSYEWGARPNFERVLDALTEAAGNAPGARARIINHVALGSSHFFRFWPTDPARRREARYDFWHAYTLEDRAFGYFVNNVVEAVSGRSVRLNSDLWFPRDGKEDGREARRRFRE